MIPDGPATVILPQFSFPSSSPHQQGSEAQGHEAQTQLATFRAKGPAWITAPAYIVGPEGRKLGIDSSYGFVEFFTVTTR